MVRRSARLVGSGAGPTFRLGWRQRALTLGLSRMIDRQDSPHKQLESTVAVAVRRPCRGGGRARPPALSRPTNWQTCLSGPVPPLSPPASAIPSTWRSPTARTPAGSPRRHRGWLRQALPAGGRAVALREVDGMARHHPVDLPARRGPCSSSTSWPAGEAFPGT